MISKLIRLYGEFYEVDSISGFVLEGGGVITKDNPRLYEISCDPTYMPFEADLLVSNLHCAFCLSLLQGDDVCPTCGFDYSADKDIC